MCSVLFLEIELDFAVPLKDVTVPEKRQARFECVLTREANVIWSKGTDILKIGEKFDIIADGKKHILVINDSQFDDEGEYTAEVEGKKSTARLFVEGKYFMNKMLQNYIYIMYVSEPCYLFLLVVLTRALFLPYRCEAEVHHTSTGSNSERRRNSLLSV